MAPRNKARSQAVLNLALFCICVMAASLRLFSVIKYESVIHEFDPYFNYRAAQFLTKEGFYEFWNWFDDKTWYPIARVIGGTIYPGLTATASIMYWILHALHIPIHIQEVCVFTAPLFSAFCALSAYGLVKEVRGEGAGLAAAAFIGAVPSYISRSVAGSFDNEAVAIFALVFTFYAYVKTLNTGSLSWAFVNILGYFYMVMSWGGYSFIINLLPIHCLACIFTGKMTPRLYVAYAPIVMLGTLLAASIPVVGFNAILMSEHFASFFAFIVLHAALFVQYMQKMLSPKAYASARTLLLTVGAAVGGSVTVLVSAYVATSPTFGWTGRSLSLLDPTYASKYIPIIASVSEHQPPCWSSYFNDLHLTVLLAPAGLISCFLPLTDASLFLVMYGITAVYFSGVMVRLMLVLAPALCCLSGIAVSDCLTTTLDSVAAGLGVFLEGGEKEEEDSSAAPPTPSLSSSKSKKSDKPSRSDTRDRSDTVRVARRKAPKAKLPFAVAVVTTAAMFLMLAFFMIHCVWVSADMYSAPSIVLQSRRQDGGVMVFDDFREAYQWLKFNTPEDSKVASWWDYGYQTTAMANRTIIVDNNTWNNTHIATVGRAMSSPERKAWEIYRMLDVDYVFVLFGGLIGYPSDDINKFLWMVRIGGGVFPEIKERDYMGEGGHYRIDSGASETMLNSLMYKLSYYNFAEASQLYFGQYGMDRVRGTEIGRPQIDLTYFEEVFTSEHWMMRIYKVRDLPLRVSERDA